MNKLDHKKKEVAKKMSFRHMSPKDKDAYVNSGGGKKLTPAQSKWKTKDWPIMQKDFKPKDTFQELAYTHFNPHYKKTHKK